MTTAIQKSNSTIQTQPAKASALNVMASRLSCDPNLLLSTLKNTVFKNASNEEMLALVVVANQYGLDPFLKEIYAFPAKGGGIVPIVSVDGWNKMLTRHPDFDGIEFEMEDGEGGAPYSCTATIHVKGRAKPVKITEYFDECKRNSEPWNNMPRRMLRNRTLCQAARMACGFSGIYHEEEAASVIGVKTAEVGSVVVVSSDSPQPLKTLPPAAVNANAELEAVVLGAGLTFDIFQRWGVSSQNVPEAASLSGFGDIETAKAKRILKNKPGLLAELENTKAEMGQ